MAVAKKKPVTKKPVVKVELSERAKKRIELEQKRREIELKKVGKVLKKAISYLEARPNYLIHHRANDHLLVFKKINFSMKMELPDNEMRFQPREWHEERELWMVFVLVFITGAKVNKLLSELKSFHIKNEESIERILCEIGR